MMVEPGQTSRASANPLAAFAVKNGRRLRALVTDPMNTWPAPWLSRKIFGNTAGISANVGGTLTLSKARRRNPARPNQEYAELGRKLDEEGVAPVPGEYSPDVVARAASGCRALFEAEDEPRAKRIVIDGVLYRTGHRDPHLRVPGYVDLVDDRVLGILSAYFRCRFEVFDSRTWRNFHVPETITGQREMLSSRWHCDTIGQSTVKLFVILSNVTDADGPLHVMPRGATREALRLGYNSRDDFGPAAAFLADPNNFFKLVGPAGTAVLGRSATCFHRAGIPQAGHMRDIAEMRFRPVST